MGRLSTKDKLRLARLKLKGVAREFYATHAELKSDEIEYTDFKAAFVQRFKDKQTDQYNYTRLQNASQMKDESPEMYLDRLRKLCQRTIHRTENSVEQAILNREAEKRLLAAFINELRGGSRETCEITDAGHDRALNVAITATNAEASYKEGDRDKRYNKQAVYTVRGNRGNLQETNSWTPPRKNPRGREPGWQWLHPHWPVFPR
jgi:hypothetical protein